MFFFLLFLLLLFVFSFNVFVLFVSFSVFLLFSLLLFVFSFNVFVLVVSFFVFFSFFVAFYLFCLLFFVVICFCYCCFLLFCLSFHSFFFLSHWCRFVVLPQPVCLERGVSYKLRVEFIRYADRNSIITSTNAFVLVDSVSINLWFYSVLMRSSSCSV